MAAMDLKNSLLYHDELSFNDKTWQDYQTKQSTSTDYDPCIANLAITSDSANTDTEKHPTWQLRFCVVTHYHV